MIQWLEIVGHTKRLMHTTSFCPKRTDGDPIAWRIWNTSQNQLWQLRQPAPPLEFPGEQGMFTDMYAQVREKEQVMSLQFICGQQDVSKRRRKKRKQVDDGSAIV